MSNFVKVLTVGGSPQCDVVLNPLSDPPPVLFQIIHEYTDPQSTRWDSGVHYYRLTPFSSISVNGRVRTPADGEIMLDIEDRVAWKWEIFWQQWIAGFGLDCVECKYSKHRLHNDEWCKFCKKHDYAPQPYIQGYSREFREEESVIRGVGYFNYANCATCSVKGHWCVECTFLIEPEPLNNSPKAHIEMYNDRIAEYEFGIKHIINNGSKKSLEYLVAKCINGHYYDKRRRECPHCSGNSTMRQCPMGHWYDLSLPECPYCYFETPKPKRISSPHITMLGENEIFVFGSNLAGVHGEGAARTAHQKFGAVWGRGIGLHGQTYAIPTMQGGVETIKPYVDDFVKFTQAHPELRFLVTEIGCGIAGFTPADIAPLFRAAIENDMENIYLPESFYLCLKAILWRGSCLLLWKTSCPAK